MVVVEHGSDKWTKSVAAVQKGLYGLSGRSVLSFETYDPPGTGLAVSEITKVFPVDIEPQEEAECYLHEALLFEVQNNRADLEPTLLSTPKEHGSKGERYPDKYKYVVRSA